MRETKTSCLKYLDLYEISWSRLMTKTSYLRDYENRSIQTTWMISYERIRQSSLTTTWFLQLWAYLNHQDMWYELILRESEDYREYDWLQKLAQSEIDFKRIIKTLLNYSLIESRQHSESYFMHSVVHDWCAEMISFNKYDLMIATLIIVDNAASDWSEAKYWISQQRLLSHADWCAWELHDIDVLNDNAFTEICDAFHSLDRLYADQNKHVEAKKMY